MTEDPLADARFPFSPPAKVPGKRAVRPRDAATLIVVRTDEKSPKLLMGRRNRGHDFMPGMWVFPGGRIDRSDYHAPHVGHLPTETLRRLTHGASESKARALALCAIRETFEETGLLLARPTPSRPGAGHWREFLAQGAVPDLSTVELIARAITPPALPKRFDARFFLASAEGLISLERQPDCGELDEIAWVDLDAAMHLDLPSITRFVIKEVAQRLENPHRPALFMRFVAGRSVLGNI